MIEIIKEYLTEIGFDVDQKSFKQAQKSFSTLEQAMNKFTKALGENKAFAAFAAKMEVAGESIAAFAASNEVIIVGLLAAIAAAVTALSTIIVLATHKFLTNMAQADIQIQLFARRLFTTVENARSLKAVMDAMGIGSMEELKDVALNPELRKQFLELRHLSAGLALDETARQGLKNVRALNFEFKKLSLEMNYFWLRLAGRAGQFVPRITQDLKEIFGIFQKMWTIVTKATNKISGKNINDRILGIGRAFETVLDYVDAILDKILQLMGATDKTGKQIKKGFNFGFSAAFNAPVKQISDSVQKIYEFLTATWNYILGSIRSVTRLLSSGKSLVQKGAQTASTLYGAATYPREIGGAVEIGAALAGIGKGKGYKPSPLIESFLSGINSMGAKAIATSGLDSRSYRSNHALGRAVDLVPTGGFDRKGSIIPEKWASLIQTILGNRMTKNVNLELKGHDYMAVISELRRRGINTAGISHQITRDWTGPHVHTNLKQSVNIQIHDARDPEKVAKEVHKHLKRQAGLGTQTLQGNSA